MGPSKDTVATLQQEPPGRGGVADESGQVLVEYGLILILVSLTALALTPLGQSVAGVFGDVAAALAAAV
jgi:Flp pilus assembly pilin Flp